MEGDTLFRFIKKAPALALAPVLAPPTICTVVRFTAGKSQSPKERSVPWKPQSQLGISPPEQSSL